MGSLTLCVPPGGEDGDGFADPQGAGMPESRGALGHFPAWKKSGKTGNSGKSQGGKGGRTALSPRVALPAQSGTAGGGTGTGTRGHRDSPAGTAGTLPPGGRWGGSLLGPVCSLYWCQSLFPTGASLSLQVPVCLYWSQFVFPVGATLLSLLVPVLCPYWGQSLFPTGASLSSLVPVPVPSGSCSVLLTGPSPSLLVPVCIPCRSQSAFPVVTGLRALLVPVYPPYWSQSVLTSRSRCSLWDLLCTPHWFQSAFLTGPRPHPLPVPLPVPVGYRPRCGGITGPSLLSLLVPVPIPCGTCSALLTGPGLCSQWDLLCFPYWSHSLFPADSSTSP